MRIISSATKSEGNKVQSLCQTPVKSECPVHGPSYSDKELTLFSPVKTTTSNNPDQNPPKGNVQGDS